MQRPELLPFSVESLVTLVRRDGTHVNCNIPEKRVKLPIAVPNKKWGELHRLLRPELPWIAGMSVAAFASWVTRTMFTAPSSHEQEVSLGVITTAGIGYLVAAMVSNANPMANMKYQDCGTGTNAEDVSDVGLQSPSGLARVVGTVSNPTATQYQNEATFSFSSTLTITEYILVSAATSGTTWDRRKKNPGVPVVSGEAIIHRYIATLVAGGT